MLPHVTTTRAVTEYHSTDVHFVDCAGVASAAGAGCAVRRLKKYCTCCKGLGAPVPMRGSKLLALMYSEPNAMPQPQPSPTPTPQPPPAPMPSALIGAPVGVAVMARHHRVWLDAPPNPQPTPKPQPAPMPVSHCVQWTCVGAHRTNTHALAGEHMASHGEGRCCALKHGVSMHSWVRCLAFVSM